MIIQDIKKKIYQILSTDLNYNIKDSSFNNDEEKIFPEVRLSLSNCTRDRYRNVFVNKIRFKIDIYSEYDGEKEILEMEEAIFDKMKEVYDIPGIIYIQENDFRILEDKSAGYILKHGVLSYTFYAGGEEETVEEEEEGENG